MFGWGVMFGVRVPEGGGEAVMTFGPLSPAWCIIMQHVGAH
jgi:hypothetical protein